MKSFRSLLILLAWFHPVAGVNQISTGMDSFHTVIRENREEKRESALAAAYMLNVRLVTDTEYGSAAVKGGVTVSRNTVDEKIAIWLGESAEVTGAFSERMVLCLGRHSFRDYASGRENWKDGADGITMVFKLSDNMAAELYLVDYYSGYRLYDTVKFREEKYTDPIYAGFKPAAGGYRTRHGLAIAGKSNGLQGEFHFLYMNLGNWGYYSTDENFKTAKGDNDYIIHSGFSLDFVRGGFKTGLLADFSRGVDRTPYNHSTRKDYIPFEGEMLLLYLSYNRSYFTGNAALVLPDSDKLNREGGDITAYGYVGRGNRTAGSPILASQIDFTPAAWITENGLEKNDAFRNGRKNSFSGRLDLKLATTRFATGVFVNYILPYNVNKTRGNIGLNRRDYEKSFYMETGATLAVKYRNVDLSLAYSHLSSSAGIDISGDAVMFAGGIQF